jgi:mRNA-degrading endonuclease RelE of RelBE toxin-antitoxin system
MREYRLEIASPARKDIRRLDKQTLKKLNKIELVTIESSSILLAI